MAFRSAVRRYNLHAGKVKRAECLGLSCNVPVRLTIRLTGRASGMIGRESPFLEAARDEKPLLSITGRPKLGMRINLNYT